MIVTIWKPEIWEEKMTEVSKTLLEKLELSAVIEEHINELYKSFAEIDNESRNMWLGMAEEERNHYELIRQIVEIVKKYPDEFDLDEKAFDIKSGIETLDLIKKSIEVVKKGTISRKRIHR